MRHHVVVTGVRNPIHLVHIASYLRSLLTSRCHSVTVAHVGGGRGLGRLAVSEQDVVDLLPDDPRLEITFPTGAARWRFPSGARPVYVSVGAPGLKPYTQMVVANHGRRPPTVVTDEGLGSYGDARTRRDAWARQGIRQPWRTVRAAAVEAGLRVLTTRRWALYTEVHGRWTVDHRVADEFRRHLAGMDPLAGKSQVAVLLTQPWIMLNAVTEASYLRHVEQVADDVARRGMQLVVRPHPAEDPYVYRGFVVIENHRPAELDPVVVAADLVLGGPSTALLNLAAVHGRPAELVTPRELDLDAMLGERQRSLIDKFIRA